MKTKRVLQFGALGSRIVGLALLCGVFFASATKLNTPLKAEAASPNDVIINELMYHPALIANEDNYEFLELYNTTGSDINLQDWKFTQGITLTFGSVIIPANDYIIISPDAGTTLAYYGKTTSATYTGKLSNSGETVTLVDDTLATINSITYADVSPWPFTPDGDGKSLELKATNLDNTLATNWGASLANDGTPDAQNSLVGVVLPTVTNVTDPNNITAASSVNITATIGGGGSPTVQLAYKLNFDSDITIDMYDDGAHNDGSAGDNVYGATIPGQPINTLVRFKISATNGSGTGTSPSADDSMNYNGYYVKDPSVTSEAPIMYWFLEDDEYETMYEEAELIIDNPHVAVFVYGNDVYDNTIIKTKGSNTRYNPKKSLKVNLPSGYTINFPDMPAPMKEFQLNANFLSADVARYTTVFWAMKQAGLPSPDVKVTQLMRNGQFEGAYSVVDKYYSGWRNYYGFDDGQIYEGPYIVNGALNSNDYQDWRTRWLVDRKDTGKKDDILDDANLPGMFNYMAMAAITHHHDFNAQQNIFYYRDDDTERWQALPWDHDQDFVIGAPRNMLNTYDMQDADDLDERFFFNAIWDEADLREAYLRRLSTLVDAFYANDTLEDKYNEVSDQYATLNAADNAKWDPLASGGRAPKSTDLLAIRTFKRLFITYYRDNWSIPPSQTQGEKESVEIEQVVADADNANEYIKLKNNAATAVDISGWEIEGIDYTIPAGAVIPKGASVYILRDDVAYKAAHTPVYAVGYYTTDLGGSGSLTLKTDSGDTIDSYAY